MTSNKEYLKNVGMEVRVARIRKGYTIPMLAKQTGLSEEPIGKLERGKSDFQIMTLKRIADALEKTVTDFFVVLQREQR